MNNEVIRINENSWRIEDGLDHFTDERDEHLLESDRYTFFVLRRILGGGCRLILSDHERFILAYSCPPYPVWIWTADGASEAELEQAYRIAKIHGLLDGKHTFNVKYEFAEVMLRLAVQDGVPLALTMNMFAYDCPEPKKPSVRADGELHCCTPDDLDTVTEFIEFFHQETGIDHKEHDACRADAAAHIDSGRMYLWRNAEGKFTASCKYGPNGSMAAVNLVCTLPECRRKHYAENLVYEVTMLAAGEGFLPMLYTNADYEASNACYEKIGYVLRGKLCTVGPAQDDR